MAQTADSQPSRPRSIIPRWVRKQFIVNARYQYRQLVPIAVCVVSFVVLAGALVFYPLTLAVQAEEDPGLQVLLQEQLMQLQVRLWPILILAGAVGGVYALQRSHKVAGPLYRLNQVLTDMASGKEVKMVKFRDGDEFREFEQLATAVANRISIARAQSRDAETALLDAEKRIDKLRKQFRDAPKFDRESVLAAIEAVQDDIYKYVREARRHRRGVRTDGR